MTTSETTILRRELASTVDMVGRLEKENMDLKKREHRSEKEDLRTGAKEHHL